MVSAYNLAISSRLVRVDAVGPAREDCSSLLNRHRIPFSVSFSPVSRLISGDRPRPSAKARIPAYAHCPRCITQRIRTREQPRFHTHATLFSIPPIPPHLPFSRFTLYFPFSRTFPDTRITRVVRDVCTDERYSRGGTECTHEGRVRFYLFSFVC